jgi:hypothetical protein
MGLTSAKIGSLFTKLLFKGDPLAAVAGGAAEHGPVTPAYAAAQGYKQFRGPGLTTVKETIKLAKEATSLYGTYAKDKETKKRIKKVEKDTKRKKQMEEEHRQKSRILRRPSRERGIL